MTSFFTRDPTRPLRVRTAALLAEGKFGEALPMCRHVVDLAPRLAAGWSDLGWALLGLKQNDEAIAACETALFIDERYVWAWNNKGAALLNLRRHEDALVALDRASALDPHALKYGRTTIQLNRLRALIGLRRFNDAVESATRLLRVAPALVAAWVIKAQALKELQRHDEAKAAFAQALKVAPDDYFALIQASLFYAAHLHDHEQALEYCQRILSLRPDDSYACQLKADLLRLLERNEEACSAYEQAIACGAAQGSRPGALWISYGLTLIEVGRYGEALAALDHPAASISSNRSVLINRGLVFTSLDRHADALDYYEAACASDPTSLLALCNRANELVALGRFAEASAAIEQVLATDDSYGCGWHSKGVLATERGHYEEARAAFQRSIALEARHSSHYADLARLLLALDDHVQAYEVIERALALDPYDMRWWQVKAQALRAAGRIDEAAAAEQRGADLLAEQTAQVDAYFQAKAQADASER